MVTSEEWLQTKEELLFSKPSKQRKPVDFLKRNQAFLVHIWQAIAVQLGLLYRVFIENEWRNRVGKNIGVVFVFAGS